MLNFILEKTNINLEKAIKRKVFKFDLTKNSSDGFF